ncbi:hypothetical protein HDV00_003050 [Rhizophlyctis rosea]|nr:hypothetical protein HDV00_003050 [Rhizophlyctis rosea]
MSLPPLPRPILPLFSLPDEIAISISLSLFPCIKTTLRLALTSTTTFSLIATNAHLWRSLYIHNEFVQHETASWRITDFPRLVETLTSATYTDHRKKVGRGRLVCNVWFRCCMLMAMNMRAQCVEIAHLPIAHHDFENYAFLKKMGPEGPEDGEGTGEEIGVEKPWMMGDGQWDADAEPVGPEGIQYSSKHGVLFDTSDDYLTTYLYNESQLTESDLEKERAQILEENAQNLEMAKEEGWDPSPQELRPSNIGQIIKFGDWVNAGDWRACGKYYVTLASAITHLPPHLENHKAKYVLVYRRTGLDEYAAVPREFAPPTFPFLYQVYPWIDSWLRTHILKNGQRLQVQGWGVSFE